MKNFSNKYIFIYSAVMVAIVAVILSVVAMGLKERQDNNIRNEKMQVLLAAINVNVTRDDAEANYLQYFTEELTVATDGTVITRFNVSEVDAKEPTRAFNIKLKDQQNLEKAGQQGAFPVYVFNKDGKKGYVIPLQGNGLWGAIYSNIALEEDFNTVMGVTFSHDSETPGLGAEITTEKFQAPFIGKKILDENGQVVSIAVKKNANAEGMHEVDAITGGTMTSNGVDLMIRTDLARYQKFIDATLGSAAPAEAAVEEAVNEEEVNHE
ncbi:MAG: NADH:ubiquinone reductase (Na(+)-transporting) subunit C [Bacteroidales bacterium]|nr:NADH:ubiquinone reductase (Na(+)-transporting) subunit C [Bacteroidales bacterium]